MCMEAEDAKGHMRGKLPIGEEKEGGAQVNRQW